MQAREPFSEMGREPLELRGEAAVVRCSGAKVFLTPSHVKKSFTAAIVVRSQLAALRTCCVTGCWASRCLGWEVERLAENALRGCPGRSRAWGGWGDSLHPLVRFAPPAGAIRTSRLECIWVVQRYVLRFGGRSSRFLTSRDFPGYWHRICRLLHCLVLPNRSPP